MYSFTVGINELSLVLHDFFLISRNFLNTVILDNWVKLYKCIFKKTLWYFSNWSILSLIRG